MATKVEKLKDLDYNELAIISVIESDEDLTSIFTDEVKLSFNMLRTLSKEDKLTPETKSVIKQLFEQVILTKTNLINRYVQLADKEGTEIRTIVAPRPEPVSDPPITNIKKEKELPRRYGKSLIQKDIAAQGGKPTIAQLTAMELNLLKNMYVNLNARLINDMLGTRKILDDEDYNNIRATIKIIETRMKPILKKK